MEGGKIGSRLFIAPRGLTHRVDDKGGGYDYDTPNDKDGIPDRFRAGGNLRGRHEAQHEGQQRTRKAEGGKEPHQSVALTEAEGTRGRFELVAQHNGGREHQHIHNQIQQYGELRENLVEGLHRGHHDKEQCKAAHDDTLHEEDVALHARLVRALKEGGQVARLTHGKDTARRTCHPGQYTGQNTQHQADGNHRLGPREVDVVEVAVESDEQRLGEVDFVGRNNEAQREGPQHENRDGHQGSDDDGLGVVARGVFDLHDVDTHHLHTGIEEEDAAGQHQVVEVFEVGEEAGREVHLVFAARGQVDNAEQDEQSRRNDGANHTAPLRDFTHPRKTLQGDKRGDPVDGHDNHEREYLVRG